jgi:restriction system protein
MGECIAIRSNSPWRRESLALRCLQSGVKPVRELFGVMAADIVANGAFFTTGDFTAEAEEWARDKNINLVNGQEFISTISQLPATSRQQLLKTAIDGDYTTPTCPSCGIKMVQRVAGKGRSEGSRFWGCPNFPRGCNQTFKITSDPTMCCGGCRQ